MSKRVWFKDTTQDIAPGLSVWYRGGTDMKTADYLIIGGEDTMFYGADYGVWVPCEDNTPTSWHIKRIPREDLTQNEGARDYPTLRAAKEAVKRLIDKAAQKTNLCSVCGFPIEDMEEDGFQCKLCGDMYHHDDTCDLEHIHKYHPEECTGACNDLRNETEEEENAAQRLCEKMFESAEWIKEVKE